MDPENGNQHPDASGTNFTVSNQSAAPTGRSLMSWRTCCLLTALGLFLALLLLGGGFYLGLTTHQAKKPITSLTHSVKHIAPTAPLVTTEPSLPTSIPTPGAMIGVAPTLIPVGKDWLEYKSADLGLSLRYPPQWIVVITPTTPEHIGFALYPPTSNPNHPSPDISFDFFSQKPYSLTPTPYSFTTQPQPITISGITGRTYQDTALAVPDEGSFIDLGYRGGTLTISTTTGPYVNLGPYLHEILSTVILSPH